MTDGMTVAHLLTQFRAARVIPVVRTREARHAATAVQWLRDAGLRIFEITMTIPDATGSSGAVTCPRLPQNVACGFPALRSSSVALQYRESLQRPIGQAKLWSQQRDLLFELVEVSPAEAPACPAAATKHPKPVTLDVPMHLLQ